jgi:hypothetical protein
MKEFVYTYQSRGYFLSNGEAAAAFGDETRVRLIIEPQDYEMKLSGETLRKVSCSGYTIEITNTGGVRLLDHQDRLLASVEEIGQAFRAFCFRWEQDVLQVCFGEVRYIDHYPNCDGEYDRWSCRWVTEYRVDYRPSTAQVETAFFEDERRAAVATTV